MRQNLLLVTASLLALVATAPASAADLGAPVYNKAPMMMPGLYDWSGLYVGINGGGGSSHNCWNYLYDPPSSIAEGCHNATGATFGGQIGYRWQASNWVFGLEGQGNWADFSGGNISQYWVDYDNNSKINSFGLITGQIGYAWNNVLLYVKGGAAVVGSNLDMRYSGYQIASASTTQWGGTIGTGLEIGFAPNWSIGFEYNHLFMGDRDTSLLESGRYVTKTDRISQDIDMALVRLNYKFGGSGY